jgi:lipopolysaccharide transport system ATP-binding protein
MSSSLHASTSAGNDVLIRAEGVSKKFCRSLKKSLWYGVKDICADFNPFGGGKVGPLPGANGQLRPAEFWAVKDISFEVRRGECLGLIGKNGAGKTTLLKMLNGLIKPDHGRITMHGRVGALIALGAGFNPILTGRENIYVNGSVLGLKKKEIDVDEIIEFAGIREFIDSPVQSYSSGMQVRLGFAIATALNPDVLILDEVLAVGDAAFRHKCYNRINKLLTNAAVIFVSHSMDYVAHIASAVMMMRHGEGELFSDATLGVAAYARDNQAGAAAFDGGVRAFYPPISSVKVKLPQEPLSYGKTLSVEVEIESEEDIAELGLSFTANNHAEQPVMNWQTSRAKRNISLRKGKQVIRFAISPLLLHPGHYTWSFGAARPGSIEHCVYYMRAGQFEVKADFRPSGNIPYLVSCDGCEVIPLRSTAPEFATLES